MKNFAVLGVGGYIAPRHLDAIKANDCNLVAGYDINDSVGILDRHYQDVSFFKTFEEFSFFIDQYNEKSKIDYYSITSPNNMHKFHIVHGLKNGADIICEKPLVLTVKEIQELENYEQKYGKKINTILQLRVHQSIIDLRNKILSENKSKKYEIDLSYFTSRGPWYHESWKGNNLVSGGLPTNIGIHFFDMLTWIFGAVENQEVHIANDNIWSGFLELEKAKVKWVLSIDRKYLPQKAVDQGKSTYRSITYDGEEIEFSTGFTELHNIVYSDILKGRGYGPGEARTAIEIVENMRTLPVLGKNKKSHPLLGDM